ncbi:MAG: hypothetical protein NUW37_20215 [Planctomycetes bacterium]|nr:hypothetical protein [Planctomycetota bacterium]
MNFVHFILLIAGISVVYQATRVVDVKEIPRSAAKLMLFLVCAIVLIGVFFDVLYLAFA